MDDTLVKVENVSKKFCRDLKKSLWYGVKDLGSELLGRTKDCRDDLRPDEFWAIKDVSFELKRGECLGLIGRNGAGKTTLLKLLNGLIKPDKGRIEMRGRVGALIALGAGFNPILTGRENIYVNAAVLGMSKKEIDNRLEEIIDFAELGEFIDAPVQSYSSGMLVRLGFAVSTTLDPEILILDEILAVGDAGFRGKCINTVDKIIKNAAVVFVSHRLSDVARVCTKIMVMDHGITVYQGSKVAEGIEKYYSQIGGLKQIISGSGNAAIHKVRIFASPNKPDENDELKIPFLSDLIIDVTFALSKGISKAILNISFMTRDMQPVAQCYSKSCGFEIENNDKPIRLRLKLKRLQFNPGIYLMAVTIVDERRGELLTRMDAAKTIQVIGSFVGNTPIQLIGKWKYF